MLYIHLGTVVNTAFWVRETPRPPKRSRSRNRSETWSSYSVDFLHVNSINYVFTCKLQAICYPQEKSGNILPGSNLEIQID